MNVNWEKKEQKHNYKRDQKKVEAVNLQEQTFIGTIKMTWIINAKLPKLPGLYTPHSRARSNQSKMGA